MSVLENNNTVTSTVVETKKVIATTPKKETTKKKRVIKKKKESTKTLEKIVSKVAEKKQFKTSTFTVDFYKGITNQPNEMKKARSRSRKMNERLYSTIFLNADKTNLKSKKELVEYKSSTECKELIVAFNKRYKVDYILNDLSVKSLYSGNDELKIKELGLTLDFIKSFLETKKATTKKKAITKKVESNKELIKE